MWRGHYRPAQAAVFNTAQVLHLEGAPYEEKRSLRLDRETLPARWIISCHLHKYALVGFACDTVLANSRDLKGPPDQVYFRHKGWHNGGRDSLEIKKIYAYCLLWGDISRRTKFNSSPAHQPILYAMIPFFQRSDNVRTRG